MSTLFPRDGFIAIGDLTPSELAAIRAQEGRDTPPPSGVPLFVKRDRDGTLRDGVTGAVVHDYRLPAGFRP
jgi:hypothetical protein